VEQDFEMKFRKETLCVHYLRVIPSRLIDAQRNIIALLGFWSKNSNQDSGYKGSTALNFTEIVIEIWFTSIRMFYASMVN